MKLKLLLLTLAVSCGVLNAQDTIRSLIISEARLDAAQNAYVEITNVGDAPLNMSDFEFGTVGPWTQPYEPEENYFFMLPDRELGVNESFVMAMVYDFGPEQWLVDPDNFDEKITKDEMWTLADIQLHFPEPKGYPDNPTDSVSPNYHAMEVWNGRDCWYIRHHVSETDSVVVDQVGGIFTEDDGTSEDKAHDVAGVTDATNNSVLVRKFSVKTGNTDFEAARGVDLADSEWMPIPFLFGGWEPNRAVFWTVGNHGDYNLNETTLVSDNVDINWQDSILTVPWGVRNDDSLMFQFDRQPGLAWHYHYAPNHEDSGYVSARTGDVLTVYACGNDLDRIDFNVEVAEPTADANIVIPKRVPGDNGWYGQWAGAPFEVTDGVPGMDSIREVPFGIRTDTMLKYLEKAPNATWEFVWVDGEESTSVENGDILRVTAESGAQKDYYIQVEEYSPSHNAYLSSITWPDIPEFYYDAYGWIGDTVPNFVRSKYDYKVQVPFDVEGIPSLVPKTEHLNAKVEVERAASLTGPAASRTITFNTTAEDDTTELIYKVQLEKEKNPDNLQSWEGEPFVSQLIFWEQWDNGFVEFCNPGTEPLDFSDYMIFFQWSNDPAEAITWFTGEDEWMDRYVKYIPGYKWQDSTNWKVEPAIAVQDLNVNPIIQPGDVFVIADIRSTGNSGYPWFASEQSDIDFSNNPWDEPVGETCARQWTGANLFLYKILNDSIKQGLKPATDPNDFELIETFGGGDGNAWVIGGHTADMINGWVRKPQYFEPKPGFKESFGSNEEDSEWIMTDRAHYQKLNVGWPAEILLVADGLGNHFMDEVTIFKSTVTSLAYKVSPGYSMEEEIRGVVTGTTVTEFLDNIIPADTGQTLIVKSATTDEELTGDQTPADSDSLIVISADSVNTSAYLLEVTEDGLNSDAVLTSDPYTITVDGETGTIEGFDYGTAVKTVMENVTVPAGAVLTVVDEYDAYVPMKKLNFDTTYTDVEVRADIYFEVIAEDGVTEITYQLVPTAEASDAFVMSEVYSVDQATSLISLVPMGTTAPSMLSNLIAPPGATVVIVDKLGDERTMGDVYKDDQVIVTAADGETTRTYYMSMLEEETFLAYVVSEMYDVDQQEGMISGSGVTGSTTLTDFYNNLTPAPDATMVVLNQAGEENTTGDLDEGDYLMVTAGDGVTVTYYEITLDYTGVDFEDAGINIYPNPSTGIINVAGLTQGTRIHVYNSVGVRLRDIKVHQAHEVISLDDQPAGIYFIVVSDEENVVGRYKLLLK